MVNTKAVAAVLVLGAVASGQTFDAVDQGWYDSLGNHDPDNENYVVGDIVG